MQISLNVQNQEVYYGKLLGTLGKNKIEIKNNDVADKLDISTEGMDALKQTFSRDLNADIVQQTGTYTPLNWLPEYSGIYETDKAIATAVESCNPKEQEYVYNIVRENFLIKDSSSMTEEERQANISLGIKKAELAAETFIPEEQRQNFLNAMETMAKLAASGKPDAEGKMNYGINPAKYLGSGSNLNWTTDTEGIMKNCAPEEYQQYQSLMDKFGHTGNTEDAMIATGYQLNWFINAVKTNPNLVKSYEEKTHEYVSTTVLNQKTDKTFDQLATDSKANFLESLNAFQKNHPHFLVDILGKTIKDIF